jgi:hypothetical protein
MQLKKDIESQAETIKNQQEQIIHLTRERDELKRLSAAAKVVQMILK